MILKNNMRVVFIHNSIPEYRTEFMRLLSSRCNVKFLITENKLVSSIYGLKNKIPASLDVISVNGIKDFFFLSKKILSFKADIVVLPPIDNFYQYACGIIALYFIDRTKTKVVYWSEGWQKDCLPFFKSCKKYIHRLMKQSIFKYCDFFIASGSKANEYFLHLGIPESKISIAYDSSTSPKSQIIDLRKLYGIPKDSTLILFLGRLVARKGCDLLIDAFNSIANNDKNAYLLICGDGDEKLKCEQFANSLECKNRIKFTGKISPADRSSYFKEADVFVLPSYSLGGTIEAWGLTVNESLEQGTPVVATDVVGAAYDLLDGECGIMVKERNVEELASAISHFLQISDKPSLSKKCIERYRQFSVENMAFSFYNAFKTVLNDEN